jgi:hypothetical protein
MPSNSTEEIRGDPGRRRKRWLFAVLATLLSVIGYLVVAEVVLNFLPVASGLRSMPVDAANPIYRFEPNRPYVYSHTWRMAYVNRGRVNNAGYVNDQDYKDDARPLIAVVGDSFIEAQMVPYRETLHGRLAKTHAGELRVYSFAASGAPLSQYLIFAQHAVRDHGARAIIINVAVNDFDESHIAYRGPPGFWLYAPDESGELRLRLQPLQHSLLRTLARHSALARYALINLKLSYYLVQVRWLRDLLFGSPAFAQSPDEIRIARSLAAIDAFLRDLPRRVDLPKDRVVLTVDGHRYPEAKGASEGDYFDRMRRALLGKASALGYEAIDLDPLFLARHRASGERFDFPLDPHWSGNGHAVAAEAVLGSRMLRAMRERKMRTSP